MNTKYFYLHIPKTAGTAFNDFLKTNFSAKNSLFHIENKLDKIENKTVIGGHLALPKAQKIIPNFDTYVKLTVFREPLTQVSSHLRFVKKLGEQSEEHRLKSHSEPIKKIVAYLAMIDFSKPKDIAKMIKWMEEKNYALFHNTQIQYLIASRFTVSEKQLEMAKKALDEIEYVGITERLDDYIYLLTYKWGAEDVVKSRKLNATTETYGLDITDPLTIEALEPLICYDKIIYQKAKERFEKDFLEIPALKEKRTYCFLDKIRTIFFKG